MKLTLFLIAVSVLGGVTGIWLKSSHECRSGCSTPKKGAFRTATVVSPLPKIPGDPKNAARDFEQIYKAIVGFRSVHNRLPTTWELKSLATADSKKSTLNPSDLWNSDVLLPEFAASGPIHTRGSYSLVHRGSRPNGQRKPDFPEKGERDLWVHSTHYKRLRYVKSSQGTEMQYFGTAVGLFSDGSIEVVPVERMLAVQQAPNAWSTYFPGEFGIPTNAKLVNEVANRVKNAYTTTKSK